MSKQKVVKESNFVDSKQFDPKKHAIMVDRDLSHIFQYVQALPQGVANSYVGIESKGMVGVGTATMLSLSGSASKSAGFLTFIFASGTSAFVPFFASSST